MNVDDFSERSGVWCAAVTNNGRLCARPGYPWPGGNAPIRLCGQHMRSIEGAIDHAVRLGAHNGEEPHHLVRAVREAEADRVRWQTNLAAEEEAKVFAAMSAGINAAIFMPEAAR